ncbi:histidine phosphatase family protein [Thioalkalivibrio sp. ALE20]|uniref:histidine phosphatase family protein n=1 Tax=Thioalkalivibrio sp. ALE20 TaxID=545275 RepID=UPI00035ECF36|nr:histidine phosphatase family protein [Thioalkalivibrio sp. ALE20]
MIVDLMRHGEPAGGQRFRGHGCDDPLSETGWRQMERAAATETGWQRIVTSPLARCRAFAEHLADERGVALSTAHDLREIGFGAWEGRTRAQLQEERPEEYRAFYADPEHNRPEGAEMLDAFRQRVAAAFAESVEAPGRSDEHVLLVVHAGVIRALVGGVMAVPDGHLFQLDCDYASLTRIHRQTDRGWRLAFTNRVVAD